LGFGSIPNPSETFGTIPHAAEDFRIIQNGAERTDQHTLTVREVARMFEQAGVARTERSMINWCQPNRQGVARVDAFFDTNERKYFITEQSVILAVGEKQAKSTSTGSVPPIENELPKHSAPHEQTEAEPDELKSLRMQMRDLEITNRTKDYIIERLEKDRDFYGEERQHYIEKLLSFSRKVGEIETQLLQANGLSRGEHRRSEASDPPKFLETMH